MDTGVPVTLARDSGLDGGEGGAQEQGGGGGVSFGFDDAEANGSGDLVKAGTAGRERRSLERLLLVLAPGAVKFAEEFDVGRGPYATEDRKKDDPTSKINIVEITIFRTTPFLDPSTTSCKFNSSECVEGKNSWTFCNRKRHFSP